MAVVWCGRIIERVGNLMKNKNMIEKRRIFVGKIYKHFKEKVV